MPEQKPRAPQAVQVVDPGVMTLAATRLSYWQRVGSMLILTFAEERPSFAAGEPDHLRVVSRVALPIDTIDKTVAMLLSAKKSLEIINAPASSSTVN